jgi:hypothetical protein
MPTKLTYVAQCISGGPRTNNHCTMRQAGEDIEAGVAEAIILGGGRSRGCQSIRQSI